MKALFVLTKREFASYFTTPVAWIFLMIFVSLSGLLTFYAGDFFGRGQADLQSFFLFHPWLYVFLIPAVSMRMWAEERRSGTIEMLMTLPVSTGELVLGKFFAAWAFVGIALLLTLPMWLTVNYLGTPDNGVILMSYLASFLIAGTFLSVGSCVSACTKSQIIAFVSAMMACLMLTFLGSDALINLFPASPPKGHETVSIVRFPDPLSFTDPRRAGRARLAVLYFFFRRIPVCNSDCA